MLLNISVHSAQTLQEQIIAQVRARILRGDLGADEALPSIRFLAKQLRVGVNTVQRAYDHLLHEQLIYARSGKGFFVAPLASPDKTELARSRFTDALRSLVDVAQREGLDHAEIKRIFSQLQIRDVSND